MTYPDIRVPLCTALELLERNHKSTQEETLRAGITGLMLAEREHPGIPQGYWFAVLEAMGLLVDDDEEAVAWRSSLVWWLALASMLRGQ